MSDSKQPLVIANPWHTLRRHTPARIALGRAGPALPTKEVLEFGLAHARARDAVQTTLDVDKLERELKTAGYAPIRVSSQAPDHATYLTRPDLGRRLDEESKARLAGSAGLVVAIEDGLSAIAVQNHAVPLLGELGRLRAERWSRAAVVIALRGRVALGDEIGERLNARLVVVMIGERPGLSSPDSLGLYITYAPRVGRTDAERNCISNIHGRGLGYEEAAKRLDWLVGAALARGVTGVALKDESSSPAHIA
ncbi:MAG: ethanolamine ammonia-lyase subunit EutC [Betaproteobacteria bacterium]|nr:ethanolamine ammonia-lyase subunit EutC [Betaproteobacteria bacterium]